MLRTDNKGSGGALSRCSPELPSAGRTAAVKAEISALASAVFLQLSVCIAPFSAAILRQMGSGYIVPDGESYTLHSGAF